MNEITEIKVAANQNVAMCLNQLDEYDEALLHCDEALVVNPSSAKAHFIKSQVYKKQTEYSLAIASIKESIKLQPNDKKLRDEYEALKKEDKKQNEGFGSKISNFFADGIYNEKKTNLKKQRRRVVYDKLPNFDEGHVQCFMEFSSGYEHDEDEEKLKGRVVFEIFDSEVPLTSENFRIHCIGEKSRDHHYHRTKVTRIVPTFLIQGGDTSAAADGEGGKSIYDEKDEIHNKDGMAFDENIWYPHSHNGTLSTHYKEKNMVGSQFMINLRPDNQYFDEKATIFGRVIQGYDFLMKLQTVERKEEKPVKPLLITDCGELRFEEKLTKEQATDLPIYDVDPHEEYNRRKAARKLKNKEDQIRKEEEEKAAQPKVEEGEKVEDKNE